MIQILDLRLLQDYLFSFSESLSSSQEKLADNRSSGSRPSRRPEKLETSLFIVLYSTCSRLVIAVGRLG